MRYLAELVGVQRCCTTLSCPGAKSMRPLSKCGRSQAGPARVRLIFENGDIARVEADDRPRMVGHRIVPTRWQGHCCDYHEMNGCRIPDRAVVSWLLEDGPFEYWRGRVTAFGVSEGPGNHP